MSMIAVVPARSGSKRLPNKNIKLLAGKPLVVWTLEACVNSKYVDRVIFSTDSKEYWKTVQHYISSDKLRLDLRTPEEAGDKVKIFDYLTENASKIFTTKSGLFLLALPTMPLRNEEHIANAYHLAKAENRGVFSAVEYDAPISFAFKLTDNGDWQTVSHDNPMLTGNTRSQDQVKAFHPNGAIYIRDIADLYDVSLKTLYQDAVPYLMESTDSIDIDTPFDFFMAENIIAAKRLGAQNE